VVLHEILHALHYSGKFAMNHRTIYKLEDPLISFITENFLKRAG
jgi:hypothetical protein